MSSLIRHNVSPAIATDICNRCHRLDIPCMIKVGSRVCVACTRSKLRCRSTRSRRGVSARFRERLSTLRVAINDVLGALDSVDLCEDEAVDSTGWFFRILWRIMLLIP